MNKVKELSDEEEELINLKKPIDCFCFKLFKIILFLFYLYGLITAIILYSNVLAENKNGPTQWVPNPDKTTKVTLLAFFAMIYHAVLTVILVIGMIKEEPGFMTLCLLMNIISVAVNMIFYTWISTTIAIISTVLAAICMVMVCINFEDTFELKDPDRKDAFMIYI